MFWKNKNQIIYLVSTSVKTLEWEAIQEVMGDYFGVDQVTHLLRPTGEVQIFSDIKEALAAKHDTLKAIFVITLPKGLLPEEHFRGLISAQILKILQQHLNPQCIREIKYDQFCGDNFKRQVLQNPRFVSPVTPKILDTKKTESDASSSIIPPVIRST